MSESQFKKIDGIFKPEKMKIRPSEIKLPKQVWEEVKIDNTEPGNGSFLDNIDKYQYNRFIDVGRRWYQSESQHQPHLCPGLYPVFFWLFQNIMEEVRDQLVFQDHLVAAVRDWKNQIIAELKSDKNIIFIGVHNRNDSKPIE